MDSGDVHHEKENRHDVQIEFPETLMIAIEELLPNSEQFDNPEFSTVTYINELFPTEQSLSNIETVYARCTYRLAQAEEEVRVLLQSAAISRVSGKQALAAATSSTKTLSAQLAHVDSRAERSAGAVKQITAEMKQLDAAKVNLTSAMTALTHCHLLCGAAADLASRAAARNYGDLLLPLQAATQVLQHFENYKDVKQISELRDEVTRIRNTLAEQIITDFKDTYTGKGSLPLSALSDVCAFADTLEPRVKKELMKWIVDLELQEYKVVYGRSEEAGSLEQLEGRFSWLKKRLVELCAGRAAALAPSWNVARPLTESFCVITRNDLHMLLTSRPDLDVKLLLTCMQNTQRFEVLLHKRFYEEDSQLEGGELNEDGTKKSLWLSCISGVFEPHLCIYIRSLEHSLTLMMQQFAANADDDGDTISLVGGVYSSCADLFVFYKKCLMQCSQLSDGDPMIELSNLFCTFLREYAMNVLQNKLPRVSNSVLSNIQQLLRDDVSTTPKFSRAEILRISRVLSTAEYCAETIPALQTKLRSSIRPSLSTKPNLSPALTAYHTLLDTCVTLLLHELESTVCGGLAAMSRVHWGTITAVGDSSVHVSAIITALNEHVPPLRDALASSRKYFTQLCLKFAESFISKYIRILFKCKPSPAGAEQLLLDTHTLKTALLIMPSIGSNVNRPAPNTYTKLVIRLMGRAEMILKLVMAPLGSSTTAWCKQVFTLLPDCTPLELRGMLDMRGLKMATHALESLMNNANK